MLPDAPWIQDAERNGFGDPPPAKCPQCGKECDRIYFYNDSADPIGCDQCISWIFADGWREAEEAGE